ncbi:MAG: DEAD/DEAH box helicase [Pseudonocardiaceae bacterium]
MLEKWFARRDDRDIVIKQNTGGGKTVAGLLIAQSTLNEGIGKAIYLAPDTYLARRVREEAAENVSVLRPAVGINPAQLRTTAAQARTAATFLADNYKDSVSLVLGVRALLDEIVWDEERTDEAEAAWEQLGWHLGFASSRPEKLYGTGSDNLWALSADRHFVVELKTGRTTATIGKKDLDQLGGSVRWDQEQHPSATSQPIMLHPSRVLDEHGTSVPSMRVVTPTKLEELKLAVVAYAVALADGQGRWDDEQAVAAQLSHNRLDGGNIFQTYTETPAGASERDPGRHCLPERRGRVMVTHHQASRHGVPGFLLRLSASLPPTTCLSNWITTAAHDSSSRILFAAPAPAA